MKKILIVDDDTFLLDSFNRALSKRGFYVETAETGKRALDKLRQDSFDVALIDVCLPDMEGTKLLVEAKKELQNTAKIMLTGKPSLEASTKANIEGADTYILKPVKIPELISIINLFLPKKTEKQEISK